MNILSIIRQKLKLFYIFKLGSSFGTQLVSLFLHGVRSPCGGLEGLLYGGGQGAEAYQGAGLLHPFRAHCQGGNGGNQG